MAFPVVLLKTELVEYKLRRLDAILDIAAKGEASPRLLAIAKEVLCALAKPLLRACKPHARLDAACNMRAVETHACLRTVARLARRAHVPASSRAVLRFAPLPRVRVERFGRSLADTT